MEREIIGFKNIHNGWSAKKEGDKFKLITSDGESAYTLIHEPFFAGSDWTPVFGDNKKEGDWIYFQYEQSNDSPVYEHLFRFTTPINSEVLISKEYYTLCDGMFYHNTCSSYKVSDGEKATKEQIERILGVYLKHKGYTAGKIVIDLKLNVPSRFQITNGCFIYNDETDSIFMDSNGGMRVCVYSKGTWAKIEEPKEEDWNAEWLLSCADIKYFLAHFASNINLHGKNYSLICIDDVEQEAKKRASENS